MACDLTALCGVSYRTYAAYKSYIYRQDSNLLHLKDETTKNVDSLSFHGAQELDINSSVGLNLMNDTVEKNSMDDAQKYLLHDDDNNGIQTNLLKDNNKGTAIDPLALFKWSFDEENDLISMVDVQKACVLFILQLREKFSLPKYTTNLISNYITLINHLQSLLEKKAVVYDCDDVTQASSSRTTSELHKLIEVETMKSITDELCHGIENATRNEYQFLNYSKQYFNYSSPEELIVSNPDEKLECAYVIPIDQTLRAIFRTQDTVIQVLDNIKQQQQATNCDEDLMFSFRDGSYGSRIDDSSLLL